MKTTPHTQQSLSIFRSLFFLILLSSLVNNTQAKKNCTLIVVGDSTADEGKNTWVPVEGLPHLGAPITNGPETYVTRLGEHLQCNTYNFAFASATTGNPTQLYLNDLHPTVSVYDDTHYCTAPGKINASFSCTPTVYQQIQLNQQSIVNQTNPLVVINAGGNDFFDNLISVLKPALTDATLQHQLNSMMQTDLSLIEKKESVFQIMKKNSSSFSRPIKNLHAISIQLQQMGIAKDQLLVLNLPKMSLVPAAREFTSNTILLGVIGLLSELYNHQLSHTLTNTWFSKYNLQTKNIFPVDQLLNEINANKTKFNLTDVIDSCVQQKEQPECPNMLFFNGKHLTGRKGQGHTILANSIFKWIQQHMFAILGDTADTVKRYFTTPN